MPRQSARAYGVEIGATGLVIWTIQTVLLVRAQKMDHQHSRAVLRVLMNQLPLLPFFIATVNAVFGGSFRGSGQS